MWERVRHDLLAAARRIVRRPGLFAATTGIVALAMGSALAMAVLLDALVFRPLPVVHDPSRLTYLQLTRDVISHANIPLASIHELAQRQRSFSAMCAFSTGGMLRVETQGSLTLNVASLVTPECVPLLGIRPYLGRLIGPQDDPSHGVSAVAVLSYDYWRARFGGDASIIGRTIQIQGASHTIVGVAEPGYKGLSAEVSSDITVPINYVRIPAVDPRRGLAASYVVGRLLPGVTLTAAQHEIDALWPAVRDATIPTAFSPADITTFRRNRLEVEPLETGLASSVRTRFSAPLVLLTGVGVLLFLVACVNATGLLVGDTAARRQEFAVRFALGGSGGRVMWQVALETAMSLGAAVLLALPMAWWVGHAVVVLIWTSLAPPALSFAPDWRLGALFAALTAGAALLMGIAPALVAGRSGGSLGARTVAPIHAPWSRPLLVGQVAASMAIAFGSMLLSRSLWNLERADPGFRVDHIALARTLPVTNGYAGLNAPLYYQDLMDHVRALPGVESVAFSQMFPSPLLAPQPAARATDPLGATALTVDLETVTPGFFATVGIPLVAGRDFTRDDAGASTPVVIVSRGLAHRLFPAGSALGQHIRIGAEPQRANLEVIGIAGDARFGDVRQTPPPAAFRPYGQEPKALLQPIVLARTAVDPERLLRPLEQTIYSLHREYTTSAETMSTLIGESMIQERAMARISLAFGGFVLLLAFVGLFARLAHDVRRRVPELGIRMALGASTRSLQGLIVAQAAWVIGLGLAVGVPVALLAGRASRAVLFELSPYDPPTLVAVAVVFALIGLAAAYIPARRASTVDPVDALRTV